MNSDGQTALDLSDNQARNAYGAAAEGTAGLQRFMRAAGWPPVAGRYDAYGRTASAVSGISRALKDTRKGLDAFLAALNEPNCPALEMVSDLREDLVRLAAAALRAAAVAGLAMDDLWHNETGAPAAGESGKDPEPAAGTRKKIPPYEGGMEPSDESDPYDGPEPLGDWPPSDETW